MNTLLAAANGEDAAPTATVTAPALPTLEEIAALSVEPETILRWMDEAKRAATGEFESGVIQVAEMMTQNCLATRGQRENVFQLPADGQNRLFTRKRQRHRLRRVPARPADQRFSAAHHSRHRIVASDVNRTVVSQKQIRDSA